MSITFSFASTDDAGVTFHGIDCRHICTRGRHGLPCEEAEMYSGFTCDHIETDRLACGCDQFDVNMANANALMVLERLGLPMDECGTIDPEDLIGRCLLGNIGRDDTGVDTFEHPSAPGVGPRMVEVGIRPGYFQEQLDRLNDLAVEAAGRGVLVGWC